MRAETKKVNTVKMLNARNQYFLVAGLGVIMMGLETFYGSTGANPSSNGLTVFGLIVTAVFLAMFPIFWGIGKLSLTQTTLSYRGALKWHRFDRNDVKDLVIIEGRFASPIVKVRRLGLELASGQTYWMTYLDTQPRKSRLRDNAELEKQDQCISLIKSWLGGTISLDHTDYSPSQSD